MSINFLGVGSGLDLQSMLDQLVQVATEPKVKQLGAKEVQVNSNISGLGAVSSALAEFHDSVDALKSSSLYGQKAATITQPASGDVLSVTAADNAVEGDYSISVEQLAQGSRAQSAVQTADPTAAEGNNGQLTFSAGGSSFTVDVLGTESLEDIVTNINSKSDNFGVSATIVDGHLVYKSSVTGAGNDVDVTNDDASLDKYSVTANGGGAGGMSIAVLDQAQNAKIDVDGISIESDTNTFDGDVTGLTITVSAADPGNDAAISVGKDTGSVSSAVNAMASAYNSVVNEIRAQSGSSDEDGNFVPGPMFGDSLLRQISSVLADSMSSIVSGADDELNNMYAIGLELQSDGTIEVDSTRLNNTLSSNFDDFSALFSDDNSEGFASVLSGKLDGYLDFDGIIDTVESGYQDQLKDIEGQYQDHIDYINNYKESLKKQFASLDSTIATLNATMSYVSGQLAQLSNMTSQQ